MELNRFKREGGINPNLAIVSSGDPERDAKELRDATITQDRISRGLCPNNCAPLVWQSPYEQECPQCHFHLTTNLAFGGGKDTLLLRTDDHPEALGREPQPGDVMYEFKTALEDGRELRLQIGKKCKESFLEMLTQLAADEACERLDDKDK